MKSAKPWLELLVLLALVFRWVPAARAYSTATVGGIKWNYTVSNGKASVGAGKYDTPAVPTTTSDAITIPSKLGGYPVTSIGEWAFDGCSGLRSVTIPDSVTSIGEYAFYGCNNLTSVTIGNGVTNIGLGAFYECTRLTSLAIPAGVTMIDAYTFWGCSRLKSVTIPDGVTFIGYHAFHCCSSLERVSIPASVTGMGHPVFYRCSSLASIAVAAGNKQYSSVNGLLLSKDGTKLLQGVNGDVTIPDSVRSLAWYAFDGCSGLTSVTIPDSVTEIGASAFEYCSGLTSLAIPASVTKIGDGVFFRCYGLKTLYVPTAWQGTSMLDVLVPEGCTVVYGEPMLALAGVGRSFTAAAASGKLLAVTANVSWTAKSSASWLTVKTADGSGNGNIEYAVAAYTGVGSRTGTITVAGGGLRRTFTVTQSGKPVTLALGAESRAFTANAASGKLLAVTANVSWTAKSSASWLTVKTASGSGNGNIEYAVAANTGTGSRTGKITVAGGGLTRTFTATQSGKATAWSYSVNNGTATVTGVEPAEGILTIPSTLGGYPVTGIGKSAFSGCHGLTSVTIPASVTNIATTWIEREGSCAFSKCSALSAIHVEEGNPVYASRDGVLFTKDGKTLLFCPEGKTGKYAVPDGVVQIGQSEFVTMSYVRIVVGWSGFAGCANLTAVTLPSSVTNIGYEAFYGCTGLKSVNIPSSVTGIGYEAFGECSRLYDTKTLPGVCLVDGWAVGYTESLSGALDLTGVRGIAGGAFSLCHDLKSVTIPASVTGIGEYAFHSCRGLKSIAVAAGNPAYAGKNGVLFTKDGKTLLCCPVGKTGAYSIPSGVTSIGDSAFMYCNGLTGMTIPSSVTNIGWGAFYGCSGLKSLTIPAGVTSIGEHAFNECYGLASLTIPNGVTSIPYGAFWDCGNLKSVKFGNNVTNIGEFAFQNCMSLASMTIPGTVKSIGWGAFLTCTGLTSVAISEGVESIGEYAFEDCSRLKSVTIPGSMKSIGDGAFHRCTSLATLMVPGGVTSIGSKAFDGCTALKTLYVPASWKGTSKLKNAAVPTGCTVKYVTYQLALGASSRTFTAAAASSKELPVSATMPWTAKSAASWLTVKKGSGTGNGTIVYDVAANTGTASRTGKITVTGGGLTRTFTVTQSGKAVAALSLGASERSFTASAASGKLLEVTANVPWTAESSASWLTVKTASGSGSGNIEYTVAANTGTGSRTATITVSGGGLTRTFTVTQSGKTVTLTLGASERTFTAAAASGKLLAVTATVSWTAKSGASWLAVKTASGSGSGNIEYAVAANTGATARTGTITVSGGGLTRTFTVTQNGVAAVLELGATDRSFTADAADGQKLSVTANVSWTAQSGEAWLTVKTSSGSGNGNIEYAVASNTGTSSRSGTITVSGGGLTGVFTVTQGGAAATLELGATGQSFTADAASGQKVSVSANVSWTVQSSAAWLTVQMVVGSGNGSITYDVAANPGTGERVGVITVAGGGLSRLFVVTQGGKSETQESPVGVPCEWLETNAAGILAANGGDYEVAAKATAANGRAVWECYVAGLSTTEKGAEFKVKSISFVDGEPVVEWDPDLNGNGTSNARAYTVEGKPTLADEWGAYDANSRFFRVRVELP